MNAQATLERPRAIGVAIVRSAEEMAAIREPGCAAAVWERDLPSAMKDWLADLAPDDMPNGRVVLRPTQVREAVEALLDLADAPMARGRDLFIEDVAGMAQSFAGITGTPYLRMRLQTVTTDSCRKFHLDAVEQRLVCTYRGPGTQYGVLDGADEPREIIETGEGAPILLRGELWRGDAPSGLRHRSPPIAGTGIARLVLVLDPMDELIEEATIH